MHRQSPVSVLFSLVVLTAVSNTLGCNSKESEKRANPVLGSQTKLKSPASNAALRLLKEGKREEALKEIARELDKTPNNPMLLTIKGDIENYKCEFEAAAADFTKALEKEPAAAEASAGRAEANLRLGNFKEARADMRKSIAQSDDNAKKEFLHEIDNLEYDEKNKIKDPAKLWALACTASLFTNRHVGCNTLLGAAPSQDLIENNRAVLSMYWRITSKSELLATLKSLITEYDNKRWQQMRKITNEPEKLNAFQSRWEKSEDFDYAINLLKQHSDEYGDRGLTAWDYCRYLNVCRHGYAAQYLTEDEAWQLMLPMAAKIQSEFKSWNQLETEYLVGFSFWCHSRFARNEPAYMRKVYRLLHDPNSPWNKLQWNTPLGVKGDVATIHAALEMVSAK